MKDLKAFTIQFVGLKQGEHNFRYQIDNAFFEHFEYDDFNDINIDVDVKLVKKSTFMEFYFKANGNANVNCDLTNEPFDQPVQGDFELVVKFGQEYNDDNIDILILPHGEYEINIAQYIYELIVLNMPNKRVHPGVKDGTLKSEVLDKLEELRIKSEGEKKQENTDPRWDELRKFLTDK
tara:strand:- start:819 stop:1355 length:537 start_codon:yes stop_codon:yes gene_type:complete